jgi:hypothetical protein
MQLTAFEILDACRQCSSFLYSLKEMSHHHACMPHMWLLADGVTTSASRAVQAVIHMPTNERVGRRCLYVDEANQLLLAATADRCAHVFDLSNTGFVPLARWGECCFHLAKGVWLVVTRVWVLNGRHLPVIAMRTIRHNQGPGGQKQLRSRAELTKLKLSCQRSVP